MFRIKICGITRLQDALDAVHFGADAIGLNFYSQSSRCITVDQARFIAEGVRGEAEIVGVFVDDDASRIRPVAEAVGLTLIQLHGAEPPELIRQLSPLPVLRAFRCDETRIAGCCEYLASCEAINARPAGVLLDSFRADMFGGTGQPIQEAVVQQFLAQRPGTPWILAGGLNAGNVAKAILRFRPSGVDTASGIESAPGIKDRTFMRDFIETAIRQFTGVDRSRSAFPG